MAHHDIEPADDGRCEIHHGVVRAVGQIPRSHAAAHAYVDRDGRAHTDAQVSHWVDREIWIAAPGRPDRRFVVGEWFGALPGHEVVLVYAAGRTSPFRLHNLSTGQLTDFFQPKPFEPILVFVESAVLSVFASIPAWLIAVILWDYLLWGVNIPHWGAFTAAVYSVVLVLILLARVPSEGAHAARRLWARRVVDARLEAFEAQRPRGLLDAVPGMQLGVGPAPSGHVLPRHEGQEHAS